jgi:hypothetical protein
VLFGGGGGSTKPAGGRKTSYWSAITNLVIHSQTANIGQFGFWRVNDEFIIKVQDDSRDDVSSSDPSSSIECD